MGTNKLQIFLMINQLKQVLEQLEGRKLTHFFGGGELSF